MIDKKKFVVNEDISPIDALYKLNEIGKSGISKLTLFIENRDNKIIGTITDGDIRRAILTNKNLDFKIKDICNRDFIYEIESDGYIDLNKARNKGIFLLPILTKTNKLSRIVDLKRTKSLLPLECVIMAGGRGKRLSPLTDKIPKPLLSLGNTTIIEQNIDKLISFGIKKFHISINYLGNLIKDKLGDGSDKGIEIKYIEEDKPLGTAGSISKINQINSPNIILINADILSNIDYHSMYKLFVNTNSKMTVASFEYKYDIPYAVLENKNNIVSAFKEKPSMLYSTNAGIYMLSKSLIHMIPNNKFFDITDLMELLLKNKIKLTNYNLKGYWIDIGKPIDYEKAKEFYNYISSKD